MLLQLRNDRVELFEHQNISPHINFTCSGSVTKWILGRSGAGGTRRGQFPELQVWRASTETGYDFQLVGGTMIDFSVAHVEVASQVFEYLVDPPLQVEAGDVLGIFQPMENESRLWSWYEGAEGSIETLYQTTTSRLDQFPAPPLPAVQTHSYLPLVTVEVGELCDDKFGHTV